MKGGNVQVRQRIREIFRFAAILIPAALVVYGFFIISNPIRAIHPEYIFPAVMIPWLCLSLVLFIFPAKRLSDAFLGLAAYHLCAGAYILLVAGLSAPFVSISWVILLLASYMYLEKKGLILSLSTLVFITILDIALNGTTPTIIVDDLASLASIFLIGAIIILLSNVQRTDSEELLRSKAQESLQSGRMHTLINNLADAVININEDGKIELYNAASLNLLNTNIGLQHQSIDDVIKVQNQSGKTVKLLQMAKKAKGVRVRDDLMLDIDGEPIRLEVTASPVRSSYSRSKGQSSTDGYILILRDITKAKSLEEERDEFISVVSHELRTPITIVEGTLSNVQLMIEKGKTPPGTLERALGEAHDQIMFLSRMVNDLSTLSRAERGVADAVEPINIRELIDSLYKEYAPQAEKKHLQFNIDTSGRLGTVTTSHLYLRELLQNLITNAIKYTKEGSVTLHADRDGKHIRFAVKDTGIGISKTDQAKIFQKFYRSEDYRTRETGGTGLGLYVAAKLSRKLGTTIEIKSRLNYGSTFSFSMPVDSKKEK
jgi:signal transduction histidine kinase